MKPRVATLKFLAERSFPKYVQSPRFSPNGSCLAVNQSNLYGCDTTHQVHLLGGKQFTEILTTIETDCLWCPPVSFHPTEEVFVIGGTRMGELVPLRVWSYPEGVQQNSEIFYTYILSTAFTHDGKCLILGSQDDYWVLSWSDGQLLNRFKGEEHARSIDIHPNGTTLLLISRDTMGAVVEIDAQVAPPKDSIPMHNEGWEENSLLWGEFDEKWENTPSSYPATSLPEPFSVQMGNSSLFRIGTQFYTLTQNAKSSVLLMNRGRELPSQKKAIVSPWKKCGRT